MTKYFAYGSNMSAQVMHGACPRHRVLARVRLPGHRLAFTRRSVRTGSGVADIVADSGTAVWGVLYELTDEDLESLDGKEGAGWAYERQEIRVYAEDGAQHDAVTYVVITRSPEEIPPSDRYAQQLIEAARERGLPEDYVEEMALRFSWACGRP